jgi:hypothetical protein
MGGFVRNVAIWALATGLGTVVAAALATLAFEDIWALGPAMIVCATHALFFGLPAALFFRRRGWISRWAAVAGGFAIGVIPLEAYLSFSELSSNVNSWSSAGPTMVNGVRTWAGWMEHAEFMVGLGGFGAGGAFAFWLTLKFFGLLEQPVPRQ